MDLFWQFLGLYLLLLIEEIGVPMPFISSSLMVAFGLRWRQGEVPLWAILLTAAAASATGTLLLYAAGRAGARPLLVRYGPLFRLTEARREWLEAGLRENGFWAILAARFVPGLTAPASLLAGALRVPVPALLAAGFIASMTWTMVWVTGGYAGLGFIMPLLGWLPSPIRVPVAVLLVTLLLWTLIGGLRWLLGPGGPLRGERRPTSWPPP